MRRLILLACIVACISTGCFLDRSLYRIPATLIVKKQDGAPLYARLDNDAVGDSIGVVPIGDTVHSYGDIYNSLSGTRRYLVYLPHILNDSAFIINPDALPDWKFHPIIFTLPRSSDKDAWERASYFVKKNSPMKIQQQNDEVIETFKSADKNDRVFSIYRTPQGDSVRYKVFCSGTLADDFARRCSYYIATGNEPEGW
jgi:hypothetical protein